MKEFEMPEIWLDLFAVEDVVTASGSGSITDSENEDQLPFG